MNTSSYFTIFFAFFFAFFFQSCANKKDILYFQDASKYASVPVVQAETLIQRNDILSISVGALVPETASLYNIQNLGNGLASQNIETIKLQGYLVSDQGKIVFPVLGKISVQGMTVAALEEHLKKLLEEGGHLVNPTVSVRILNAKVTILGEVNRPGTFSFLEQYVSVPQALGYAGDLTINGKRNDILLIRESEGVRTITHVDLTTASWMNDPKYRIKQNDVLVINPNNPKIKTAGYVGNTSVILTIASLILSSIVLLTR
ncbi:polysaccharide biosynthesis/export family protein [Flavobacterium aquiphilum]|uniref:polysaccharide biosynthesis/export family protein n=1 Tax=Flavobacterium aquiphilum TaxID=3003261 RepID=UPI00248188BB|nr:polysaccharide biosynthesis/export family protein [Flavobacterium aquiphilum]